LVCGGWSLLAPVPPCPSVLPPGAGNEEAEEAVDTGKERAKKTEERYVLKTRVAEGQLNPPAIRRDDDSDVAAIAAVEQTQRGLPNVTRRSGRFAQSTGDSVFAQPPGPHAIARIE